VCAVTSVFRPLPRWLIRLRFDTFSFLSPALGIGLKLAYGVVVCELLANSFIRYRFTGGKLANAIVQVVIGGGIAFAIGAWFGRIGVS
jgi:erythrin-vacuolar iron transport family protein